MVYTVEQLQAAGGKLWERGELRRVYFNDLEALYGLQASRYNTGNICAATLDGAEISNAEAGRIAGALANTKIWYDFGTGKFHFRPDQYAGLTPDSPVGRQGSLRDVVGVIRRAIESRIEQQSMAAVA